MATEPDDGRLQRRLTFPLLLLYGLGITVGAGIYVLIGLTSAKAGIYAPLSFLVAAGVVAFTGFSYAELTTRYPVSAGEAEYVQQGLNSNLLARLTGLLVIASALVSCATISVGATAYIGEFIPLPPTALNIIIVVGLGVIAAWGIAQSVKLAAILTLIEIGGLLFVIYYGLTHYPNLASRTHELVPPPDIKIWGGILSGGLIAFFAFIGFEDMANVAEEVINPARNLPRAIILTLIFALILYLSVVSVVVLTVPINELRQSSAPLSLVFQDGDEAYARLIGVIAGIATLNGVLIQIIMASRVTYGMSSQKLLPAPLARIHPKTGTPVIATFLIVILILVFALLLPIQQLAELTSRIVLATFVLVNLALIALKRRRGAAPDGIFQVPLIVPVIGIVSCLLLFVSSW